MQKGDELRLILCGEMAADERLPVLAQRPDAVTALTVDDLQRIFLFPIREKHIPGALHRDPVALPFLDELIFRPDLALCQMLHHLMQLIHLPDTGRFEILQASHPAPDAVHETVHRAGNLSSNKEHDHHANDRTDDNGYQNLLIDPVSQSKYGILGDKPAQHPVFIFIGYLIFIQMQRRNHRIDRLLSQGDIFYAQKIRILCIFQGKEVFLESPDVDIPIAARYGWADTTECNLYGTAGLPVAPFRTDK